MMNRLPPEIDALTYPQFWAAFDGFAKSKGAQSKTAPSKNDLMRAVADEAKRDKGRQEATRH